MDSCHARRTLRDSIAIVLFDMLWLLLLDLFVLLLVDLVMSLLLPPLAALALYAALGTAMPQGCSQTTTGQQNDAVQDPDTWLVWQQS